MLSIDCLNELDLPAALRLSTQAGWNQIDADWRRLFALWPDTCLAGRLDGHLVATATLATYGDVGWVGMVLVDESHRRRGFGTQMLDAVLDLGRARGVRRFGLDATDLGRPVYLRRGFVDALGIDRWVRAAGPPARRVPGGNHPDLGPCLPLDFRATGVDRRRLLAHLASEAGVHVVGDGGDAYAVLRPGRTADHIGPVVASTEDGAEAVLTAALLQISRGAMIDVPRDRLARFLPGHGFQPARRLFRMQTGTPTLAPAPLLAGPGVFAAGGFELG